MIDELSTRFRPIVRLVSYHYLTLQLTPACFYLFILVDTKDHQ